MEGAKSGGGLPDNGYALIIDGRVKTEFETRQGADEGARDLKRRFPTLKISVYDALAMTDHEVVG